MPELARQPHFRRQIVRADADDIDTGKRGDRLDVLDAAGTFEQYFHHGRLIQRRRMSCSAGIFLKSR